MPLKSLRSFSNSGPVDTRKKRDEAVGPHEKTGGRPRHGGMLVTLPTCVKYIKLSQSLFGPVPNTGVAVAPCANVAARCRMMIRFARYSARLMASATLRRDGGRHEGRWKVRRGHGG